MRRCLLGVMSVCCGVALTAHAQDQTLASCASRLEAQGFEVIDRDFDDGFLSLKRFKPVINGRSKWIAPAS